MVGLLFFAVITYLMTHHYWQESETEQEGQGHYAEHFEIDPGISVVIAPDEFVEHG